MKIRKYTMAMKVLLPFLFVVYVGFSSLFTHSHEENGLFVVHSHPYQKDSNGKLAHKHTANQFFTIQALTYFASTAQIILIIILGLFRKKAQMLVSRFCVILHIIAQKGTYLLRPPPSFYTLS